MPNGSDFNEITNFLIAEHVVFADGPRHRGRPRRDRRARGARRHPRPTPAGPFAAEVGRDPGRLRIGLLDHEPTGTGAVDPERATAVRNAATLLEGLGHTVEPSFPEPWSDPEAMLRFSSVWAAECALTVDDWSAKVGREATEDDLEPLTWVLAGMGRRVTAPTWMRTVMTAFDDARRAERWWRGADRDGFDLLLTPTLAEPPVPHGQFGSTRREPARRLHPGR